MKYSIRLALVLVLLLTTVGVASAAFTGPYYDTWTQIGPSGTNNPTAPQILVQDSLGQCNDTQVGYFQWNADWGTVTSASLVLTHGNTLIGLNNSPTLTLYGVADFDQATLNGANAPLPSSGEVIQSVTLPSSTTAGTKVTFGGADPALANYLRSQATGAGDKVVTLALSFSANCNSNNSQVNFYSSDYTTTPANRPQLSVEGTKANAVDVASTSAERATSWPLYAGLAAVALVVVAGVMISKRRTA